MSSSMADRLVPPLWRSLLPQDTDSRFLQTAGTYLLSCIASCTRRPLSWPKTYFYSSEMFSSSHVFLLQSSGFL